MKILLNETETAEQRSLKTNTLRKWRCLGKGPSFVKFGSAVRALSEKTYFDVDRLNP
jgi:hypothetical protein